MENKHKNQIFTIPNFLSLFRIILIPAMVYLYTIKQQYILVTVLYAVSGITDILDGFIARKTETVTDIGKVLDPVADKLTQGALMICLLYRYPLMWLLLIGFILTEVLIGILGLIAIKRTKTVISAQWYGKAATVTMFLCVALLILFPEMPIILANILILVCLLAVINACILYGYYYIYIISQGKEQKTERDGRKG